MADSISLPKGGGAVRGIGETFSADPFTGGATFSIPIPVTPSRGGFQPQLQLQYHPCNGNGLFGLGWSLSVPSIHRKTEKGLPTYTSRDTYLMTGYEDLVPYPQLEGIQEDSLDVRLFRPRTEGLFAHIEKIAYPTGMGEIWQQWIVKEKNNIRHIYRDSANAAIHNGSKIFEWLISRSMDALGNQIIYEYAQDPKINPSDTISNERALYLQKYLRRIRYGNKNQESMSNAANFAFEILFDYGDIDGPTEDCAQIRVPDSTFDVTLNNAPVRPDPFSSFRAGFEIRTLRRCRRILILHHVPGSEETLLVKSFDLKYEEDKYTHISLLRNICIKGFRKVGGKYIQNNIPPLDFSYSCIEPEKQKYHSIEAKDRDLPPAALNDHATALVDLFGDGLPDVVQGTPTGMRYWRNRGDGRLDRPQILAAGPSGIQLGMPGVAFTDTGGDGMVDLMVRRGAAAGFFEMTAEGGWNEAGFRAFQYAPPVDFDDLNMRLFDITGDGLPDILVTDRRGFLWYRGWGEAGFDPNPVLIPRIHDLQIFPDVYFNDPAGRVRLADMTGDGLLDIVFMHDGRIDYWPNLGYGRFAPRRTMMNTPLVGASYDPRRVFLVDIDGSGTTDLVFIHADRVKICFNRSGNGWSDALTICGTPFTTDLAGLSFTDFFGSGTKCLIWSYPDGGYVSGNYKVLDFCGRKKPYLLVEACNNMGGTTALDYAPSTQYCHADAADGQPWVTALPFPVQLVARITVTDAISRSTLETRYEYHHGYYDGREREFRGFARVDQYDTLTFDELADDSSRVFYKAKDFHTAPTLTKTWFHTGAYLGDADLFDHVQGEYCKEAPPLLLHRNSVPDNAEAARAMRGAILRQEVFACDQFELQEKPYIVTENAYRVQEFDSGGHESSKRVYLRVQAESVTQHFERACADPRTEHRIVLARNGAGDLVDLHGNVTDEVTIAYPRKSDSLCTPDQGRPSATYVKRDYVRPKCDAGAFRHSAVCQVREFELCGLSAQYPGEEPDARANLFCREDFVDFTADLRERFELGNFSEYQEVSDDTCSKRLIGWTRTYFKATANAADFDGGRLELGEIDAEGLEFETIEAALTDTLAETASFGMPSSSELATELKTAGYRRDDNAPQVWWRGTGRTKYDRDLFFLPTATKDPFGNVARVDYDAWGLLPRRVIDPMGNVTEALNDYRVMQPFLVRDANGNHTEVAFDALGLVAGTALLGKAGRDPIHDNLQNITHEAIPALLAQMRQHSEFDSLAGFEPDLVDELCETSDDPRARLRAHLADPLGVADPQCDLRRILVRATSRVLYDLHRCSDLGEPPLAMTVSREAHSADTGGDASRLQISCLHFDGLGRDVQTKVRAEPGPVPIRDPETNQILVENGDVVLSDDPASVRWVGSGWTIYNNKGKPVRQFEPFFSDTHRFDGEVRVGVSPILIYDPLMRVVGTIHPDHTWEFVSFDAWRQETWDVNDTVLIADPRTDQSVDPVLRAAFRQLYRDAPPPNWYASRIGGDLGAEEREAAEKAATHAATPNVVHLDPMGRPAVTVQHNRARTDAPDEFYETRVERDIEGNERAVFDALGRCVMRYDYDMLGRAIRSASIDAGARRTLHDVAGEPVLSWDSRGHCVRTVYDALRRPTEVRVGLPAGDEILAERTLYGESLTQELGPHGVARRNLRGVAYRVYDGAGLQTTEACDAKGNILSASRRLAKDPGGTVDWSAVAENAAAAEDLLEAEIFVTSWVYDALDRAVEQTTPDGSRLRQTFNDAGLLERVSGVLGGSATETAFVRGVDYDAKGQRTRIEYGNGVVTTYAYDRETFRLRHMRSTRPRPTFPSDCPETPDPAWPGCDAQNLRYWYDPVGNITRIRDDAQQTIFFANQRVDPSNDYVYDALYRLIEATGREHLGLGLDGLKQAPRPSSWSDAPRVGLHHPGDGRALGRYTETYAYDPVGNIKTLHHSAGSHGRWTRRFQYDDPSPLEAGQVSNRLSRTADARAPSQGVAPIAWVDYAHDANGNMVSMPHLTAMAWSWRDELALTARSYGFGGPTNPTRYAYDASGERVRKTTCAGRDGDAAQVKETIYLGGFEITRKRAADGTLTLERQTLHVMDGERRIALVETRTEGADPGPERLIRYQFGNHLGSATLELDAAARVISYEEYTPYGSAAYQGVRSSVSAPKRYRFTGMERDEESGLGYHYMRYYCPTLMRWVSCDPDTASSQLCLYEYANSNALMFIDKDGREAGNPPESKSELYNLEKLSQSIKEESNNPSKFYKEFKENSIRDKIPKNSDFSKIPSNCPPGLRCVSAARDAELVWKDRSPLYFQNRGKKYNLKGMLIDSSIYDPPIESVSFPWTYVSGAKAITEFTELAVKKILPKAGRAALKKLLQSERGAIRLPYKRPGVESRSLVRRTQPLGNPQKRPGTVALREKWQELTRKEWPKNKNTGKPLQAAHRVPLWLNGDPFDVIPLPAARHLIQDAMWRELIKATNLFPHLYK